MKPRPKMRKLTKEETKEYWKKLGEIAGTSAWGKLFGSPKSWMNRPTFQISTIDPKKVIKKPLRESLLQGGGNPVYIIDKEG